MSSELRPRRRPSRRVRRRRTIVVASIVGGALVIAAVTAIALTIAVQGKRMPMPVPTPSASRSTTPVVTLTPSPTPTSGFDKKALSIDDPSSYWIVVDKLRPLDPQDYEPSDLVEVPVPYVNQPFLRQVASDAVVQMFATFNAETGLSMQAQSAYRSYSTQVGVYQGWVDQLGQAGADLTSARPGFSEHQTGLAIDINALPDQGCALEPCWGDTPHAQWLQANSWRFGFIVRYTGDKTAVTGYEYEPYHLRYVGVELATQLHDTGVTTLEEFFGLPAAPDYGS